MLLGASHFSSLVEALWFGLYNAVNHIGKMGSWGCSVWDTRLTLLVECIRSQHTDYSPFNVCWSGNVADMLHEVCIPEGTIEHGR